MKIEVDLDDEWIEEWQCSISDIVKEELQNQIAIEVRAIAQDIRKEVRKKLIDKKSALIETMIKGIESKL